MEPTPPYWHRASGRRLPPLAADAEAEVIVVGGGFAGLATALQLLEAKPGLDLMILEAEHLGFGASGRNGGIIEAPLLVPTWLLEGALPWEEARSAIERLHRRVESDIGRLRAMGAQAHVVPSRVLFSARSRVSREALRHAHRRLAETSVPSRWVQPEEVEAACGSRSHGALDLAGFVTDPMEIVRTLAGAVQQRGARIHEGTRVLDLGADGRGTVALRIEGGHRARARSVVICVGAWARAFRTPARRQPKVHPVAAYVVATEPLDEAQLRRLGGDGCSVSEVFSMSYRRVHDRRLLFGGAARILGAPETSSETDRRALRKLVGVLGESLPWLKDVRLERAWGGLTTATQTGVPRVGADPSIPGIVHNVGHPAFALALLGGAMVRSDVLGGSYADDEAERLRAAYRRTRVPWRGLVGGGLRWLAGAALRR